jgi:proteasome lid subunit RPN8/RPN11
MKNLTEFKEHILSCYPQEACGVVIDGSFLPLENVHPSPADNFLISERDTFALLGKTYSVVHSHTMESFSDDPRTPSHEDTISQNNSKVPWGIVHCDGENVSEVLWFGLPSIFPLLGRSYIANVYDCFTLARDYFYNVREIDLGTHPRPVDWQEWNPNYIADTYLSQGFSDITYPMEGDVLLFAIGSRQINHIGIFLGGDTFIHHLHKRKSCEDSVSKWRQQLIKIVRLG